MLAASQDGSCVECLESQLQGDEQIEQSEQNEQTSLSLRLKKPSPLELRV